MASCLHGNDQRRRNKWGYGLSSGAPISTCCGIRGSRLPIEPTMAKTAAMMRSATKLSGTYGGPVRAPGVFALVGVPAAAA